MHVMSSIISNIMWVSHAERPLRVDELCQALAVELGSNDFNAGNAPSILTLMSCCQGLITVDKETSTVRLINFTLQDYLSARPDLFNAPHSTMAEICLTYLNSEQVKTLSADSSHGSLDEPFLKYSSRYWGVHAKRQTSNSIKSLAVELLREYDSHISARYLLAQAAGASVRFSSTKSRNIFGGLHCASFFGIVELIIALIEMGCCYINRRDCLGRTPLAWATLNGHGGAMKILLRQEKINPHMVDKGGRTPLSHAAQGGNEALVKLLLRREGPKPDKPSYKNRTPLSYAAEYGSEEVVKVLLMREEVDPDKPCLEGRTPLSYAAECGSEGVVKVLLQREEVNPDRADASDITPLFYAARGGSEEVVKALLRQEGVNPDRESSAGGTPLLWAVAVSAGGQSGQASG